MDNLQKYKPTDKMIDLISDNYSLLQVMSRFGLSLGFGDKTVKEVCELNGVDCRTFLILKFFDEYTKEVRKHMDYEEKTVFKYVDLLIKGDAPKNYQISTFSKHHDQVGEKLTELKNIIIKYCPAKANENLLNAALFDIYACEAGLESHCKVEDYIFVPAILKLERRIRENEK